MADPREAVVAAAQAMLARGLVVATQGNVSARDGGGLWITPAALPYPGMTTGDLVQLGLDGSRLAGAREPSSEWRVHATIYAARPDVRAIAHTHSVHATAWSFLGEELALDGEDAGHVVRTARFAPAGGDALAAAAAEALGTADAVLLARHGVVGVGPSAPAALETCTIVEHMARVAWLLWSGRGAAAPRA
jgi:L-fuculose-phosphate aldolase